MRPLAFPLAATAVICVAGLLQACGTAAPAAPATAPLMRLSDGDGNNPAYAYRLGRAYEGQGDLARASAAYARSLALDPAQLDARNAQAVLLAKQGQLAQAAELLRLLVMEFPAHAQPMSNLGFIYHLQGDDALAATTLRSALALEPAHGAARANLALVTGAMSAAAASFASPSPATPARPEIPAAALSLTTTPQLQLVRLAPNELRLQAPVAMSFAAPASATAMPPVASSEVAPVAAADLITGNLPPPECLHIINANGIRGAAARMRDVLRQRGFAAASSALGNQPGYQQAHTVIEYVPGQEARARALRTALRGAARLAPVASLPRQVTLRLVLGQDQLAITPNLLARHERPASAFNQESP